jgi:hypothetical protein
MNLQSYFVVVVEIQEDVVIQDYAGQTVEGSRGRRVSGWSVD